MAAPMFRVGRRRGGVALPVIALVLGVLLFLAGLGLLIAGAGPLWLDQQRDRFGFVTSDDQALTSDTAAITAETITVRAKGTEWLWKAGGLGTVRVRATGRDGAPTFIGIARERDVDTWLSGIAHDQLRKLDPSRASPRYRRSLGIPRATPPAKQNFWEASASGPGTQSIRWDVQSGRWAIVLMNPGGSPGVAADVDVGSRLPALHSVGIALVATGAGALVPGIVLIALGGASLGRWMRKDQLMFAWS
jgi:hypothetical protein